jgi:alginate production protein
VTQFLKYQYSFGSESDVTYRQDPDLDARLRDNSLIVAPQLNGYIIYRPTDWVEMMLEMFVEREFPVKEEKFVTLPTGETKPADTRRTLLGTDQAFVTFKHLGPLDLTLGRRNFEDERHWLYDTSLDAALAKIKLGNFQTELSVSRKELLNLDPLKPAQGPLPRNIDPASVEGKRTDNYIVYTDYRGIAGIRLGGYAVFRDDRAGAEGRPLLMGVRANGKPTDQLSFWSELAFLRGTDERGHKFKAQAVDVGGTVRFPKLPLSPSFSLGYAYATGDADPNDSTNYEFRQTGLQSNEAKLAGVAAFKYYGEAIDPELSNVQIFTAAVGFRPAANIFVDLVYHKYRLNELADEIRNWAFTAQMNQVDSQLSKDVGSEIDHIIGIRNVFGVRRLGVDLRVGVFYPGTAFLRNDGAEDDPVVRRANTSISVLAKFWF